MQYRWSLYRVSAPRRDSTLKSCRARLPQSSHRRCCSEWKLGFRPDWQAARRRVCAHPVRLVIVRSVAEDRGMLIWTGRDSIVGFKPTTQLSLDNDHSLMQCLLWRLDY